MKLPALIMVFCGLIMLGASACARREPIRHLYPLPAVSSASPTPSQSQWPPETPLIDDDPSVHPGAFCAPYGASGTYHGGTYVCGGPNRPRWRRQ